MDKGKDHQELGKNSRVSELAALILIIVCILLVGAELLVNVLDEIDQKSMKQNDGHFVAEPHRLQSPARAQHDSTRSTQLP